MFATGFRYAMIDRELPVGYGRHLEKKKRVRRHRVHSSVNFGVVMSSSGFSAKLVHLRSNQMRKCFVFHFAIASYTLKTRILAHLIDKEKGFIET